MTKGMDVTRLDLEHCYRSTHCEDCHRPLGWDDAHPWQWDDGYGTVDVLCDSCKELRETAPCGGCGERHPLSDLRQCDALGVRGGLACEHCEAEIAAEMADEQQDREHAYGARSVGQRGVCV